jgi:hypothetical protein
MPTTDAVTLGQLAAKLGITQKEMETRLMALGWAQVVMEADRQAASEAWEEHHLLAASRLVLDLPAPHQPAA